ncbi:MAG: hypothetical protein IKS31_08035 [Clostridia bacterium]|nr:hypothetical protein [Clostridia bacterium]
MSIGTATMNSQSISPLTAKQARLATIVRCLRFSSDRMEKSCCPATSAGMPMT